MTGSTPLMQNKTILDLNSLGFHFHQCGAVLKAGDQQTQAVFGVVQAVRDIATQRRGTGILGVWDGRSWRKDFFAEYKADREETAKQRAMRADYHSQTPYIRKALEALGVAQAQAINLEADDLAAILSKRYADKGERVWLYTRDSDWQQLVRPGVVWIDHSDKGNRISHKNFREEVGLADGYALAQVKALKGERGEAPAVGGIGEVKAKHILEVWGSVDAFLADPNPAPKWQINKTMPAAVLEFHTSADKRAAFARNMTLVNLATIDHLPKPEKLTVTKGKLDVKAFTEVCRQLAFHSILKDLPNFIAPFQPTGE